MKLRQLLLMASPMAAAMALAISMAGLLSCDDGESRKPPSEEKALPATGREADQRAPDDSLSAIRARADAAFEQMSDGRERFETRIGPQSWPKDLPGRWPEPHDARVVADSRKPAGQRILLIDLPGTPDDALESYGRRLEDHGYQIDRTDDEASRRALRAKRGASEAVMTFFRREQSTRLEILFIERVAG